MSSVTDLMAPVRVKTMTRTGIIQSFLMDKIKADNLKVDGAIVEFLPDEVQGGVVPIMFINGKNEAMMNDSGGMGQSLIHLITGRKGMFSYVSDDHTDLRQSNLISRKQKNTYKLWQR